MCCSMAGGAEEPLCVGRDAGESVDDDVFAKNFVEPAGVVIGRDSDQESGAVGCCGSGHL